MEEDNIENIDDSVLKMLTKKKNNVEVVILTSNKSNIQNIDIQKFNKEYPVLKIAKTNTFHYRFIVIDNKEMYHLGAYFNGIPEDGNLSLYAHDNCQIKHYNTREKDMEER